MCMRNVSRVTILSIYKSIYLQAFLIGFVSSERNNPFYMFTCFNVLRKEKNYIRKENGSLKIYLNAIYKPL